MDVTAKELKLRLGKYLAAAERGEVVRVTKRGNVVAEIGPPARASERRLQQLIAQGRITPGRGGKLPPFTPLPGKYSTTEIINADRGDERS